MPRYLRKFRKQSPKGEMSREQFTPIFETSYPTAGNPRAFVDTFFSHWLPEAQRDLMDFKARIRIRKKWQEIRATSNCKSAFLPKRILWSPWT